MTMTIAFQNIIFISVTECPDYVALGFANGGFDVTTSNEYEYIYSEFSFQINSDSVWTPEEDDEYPWLQVRSQTYEMKYI